MVPLQNFSQGMLLTEDMISFQPAAVQLVNFIIILHNQAKQKLLMLAHVYLL